MIKIKDLRFILFEELFTYFPEEFENSVNYQLKNMEIYLKRYDKFIVFQILVLFICKIIYSISNLKRSKKNKKTILFQNKRALYPSILEKLYGSYNIVLLGDINYSLHNSLQYAILKHKFDFIQISHLFISIYKEILNKNELKLHARLNELINVIRFLNPDLIVLQEDGNIDGRSLALAAKELGIPSIVIQDGIFISSYNMIYGRYVDYMFVWGNFFKKLYLDQNIKQETNIQLLGYPYNLIKSDLKNENSIIVYFLGQNYEAWNKDLLKDKIDAIKNVKHICFNLGFDFIYRPHPGDDIDSIIDYFSDIKFSDESETLSDSFKKGDIFISFDSTSLVEAVLNSKIGIQLLFYNLITDNFEDLGVCSRTCFNYEELREYLREISETDDVSKFYKPVDSKYVELAAPDPGTRFLELINKILYI